MERCFARSIRPLRRGRRGSAAGGAAGPAYTPPPPGAPGYVYADVSPGLALFLGMIPGVGAIYNGQYAKGLVHAVVFGVLCSIADSRATATAGVRFRDDGLRLVGVHGVRGVSHGRASGASASRWTSTRAS